MVIHETHSPEQTEAFAAEWVRTVQRPLCVLLEGELGAGKTCFTRGLVTGLGGARSAVHSPTYMLINLYPTPAGHVVHVDAYRLQTIEAGDALGLEDLLPQAALTVIEWPQRLAYNFQVPRILIKIEVVSPAHRKFILDQG